MIRYPQGRTRVGEDERPTSQTTVTETHDKRTTNKNTDSTRECSCGKLCKNERGLKIHRTKMGCQSVPRLEQRKGKPNETEEERDQETHHRVHHLYVPEEVTEGICMIEEAEPEDVVDGGNRTRQETANREDVEPQMKANIKWPSTADRVEWSKFDEDLDRVLESTIAGNVDRRLTAMSTIICTMGKDRFGSLEKRTKTQVTSKLNRRELEIANLRKEIRCLSRQFREATEEEKEGLKELRKISRERIQT